MSRGGYNHLIIDTVPISDALIFAHAILWTIWTMLLGAIATSTFYAYVP